jgi:hypothetical protein
MRGMGSETQSIPPLIGRKEVARILGVQAQNVYRVKGLPSPIGKGIEGFEVSSGPLWLRSAIEALAAQRKGYSCRA